MPWFTFDKTAAARCQWSAEDNLLRARARACAHDAHDANDAHVHGHAGMHAVSSMVGCSQHGIRLPTSYSFDSVDWASRVHCHEASAKEGKDQPSGV